MTQQQDSTYIDDEIDLMPYIKHVVNNWRLFIYASVIGIIIALLLSFILPKNLRHQPLLLCQKPYHPPYLLVAYWHH